MSVLNRQPVICLIVFAGLALTEGRPGDAAVEPAAETADASAAAAKTETPIFVLNAAGVDRLLSDSDHVLKLVEKPELSLVLRGMIAVSTNGLKGIGRKRPFGLMTFIDPGVVPEPVGVAYVPLTDSRVFLATLQALKVDVQKSAKHPAVYRLDINGRRFAMVIRKRYAFLARKPKSLQRSLPNPTVAFAGLSRRYDAVAQLRLDELPAGLTSMVLDYLRAATETAFRRQPGEEPSRHRLRVNVVEAVLAGLDELVRDGLDLTLGLRVSKSSTPAELEVRLAAKQDSRLEHGLKSLGETEHRQDLAPPGKSGLKMATDFRPSEIMRLLLDAVLHRALRRQSWLAAAKGAEELRKLHHVFASSGFRFAAWVVPTNTASVPPIVAVMAIPDAESVTGPIQAVLKGLEKQRRISDLKTTHMRQNGVKWRRFQWRTVTGAARSTAGFPHNGDIRVGGRTLWLALGREDLRKLLDGKIAASGQPGQKPRRDGSRTAPADRRQTDQLFQFSASWNELMKMQALFQRISPSGPAPALQRRSPVGDELNLRVTRRETDVIIRLGLQAGVLRAVGRRFFERISPRPAPGP